ncbi:sulfatase [Amycolatopsis sp. NPDC051903]|uniref:sulfatase n=1 Tax=Amycolatopsis sp. NPDC051903 TaxID=3363936 RepID=UPI003795EB40
MRAIVLMFDTLNRRHLEPYGSAESRTPNFTRLAQHTTRFTNCYAGSMPCMPARRELHTGRYNFLHRSWGPLEPFDDSAPQLLRGAGVYTHLVTDHYHYWEDGGLTYHNRFDSYEFFRGQEGDGWKGHVADPVTPDTINAKNPRTRRNWISREYQQTEDRHSQTLTVDAGLEFLGRNHTEDDWLLQIECFDPHEPFFTYDKYLELFEAGYEGRHFDWPAYKKVVESDAEAEHLRNGYLALLAMCDHSLGRVLDFFDEHEMWRDTMLVVCTDHGFLLGEHGWWGKSVQPWYDENIHTPLFVWDPRHPAAGESRTSLVQTIDLAPTLLEFFGLEPTADMQGKPLASVLTEDRPIREGALFGSAGGHVNVTDGRYAYLRNTVNPDNQPLFDYTLMPTHMHAPFSPAELREAELVEGFGFTKGVPVLKVPGWTFGNPYPFGTMLFDLETDPRQQSPLSDPALELRMIELLVKLMRENEAPPEQYERLGLPATGPVTEAHLLADAQRDLVDAAARPPVRRADLSPDAIVATVPIRELFRIPRAREAILPVLPRLDTPTGRTMLVHLTVVDVAAMHPDLDPAAVYELEKTLGALSGVSAT